MWFEFKKVCVHLSNTILIIYYMLVFIYSELFSESTCVCVKYKQICKCNIFKLNASLNVYLCYSCAFVFFSTDRGGETNREYQSEASEGRIVNFDRGDPRERTFSRDVYCNSFLQVSHGELTDRLTSHPFVPVNVVTHAIWYISRIICNLQPLSPISPTW